MNKNFYNAQIAQELRVKPSQVAATVHLLEEGASIPFIARYRKEATGSLDEVAVTGIRDRLHQLNEMDKRRATILESIQQQGKLTEELNEKILACATLTALEDIYLPYRPKRRTRASIAKEKGLEPLAQEIFAQEGIDPAAAATGYVNAEKKVNSVAEALAGARDIIAEWVSEDAPARSRLRALFRDRAVISSRVVRGKEKDGSKYKDYFEREEPVKNVLSHRILALRRGEKEEFLTVRILPPEEEALPVLVNLFVQGDGKDAQETRLAVEDGYKRLLSLSLETEIRLELKKRADHEAVEIFKNNLRQLLLAPPLGQKNVLAIDPGFRTGCKLVCLDRQGKLLHHETIYITGIKSSEQTASRTVLDLCRKYKTEVIAIGHGTAGRETEVFIRGIGLPQEIHVVMVNESGASIYSASEAAREEFSNYDVTVRGSVSIGRRLMDPLAELVKIDPKSIGVGQYQHDVDQNLLKDGLDDVVISCVNLVGVEVNTASKQLLTYVSGLGPVRAQAILDHRNTHGPFHQREELKKVAGLGPKAFEQAAGFLRIHDAKNPLDASAVHPESYCVVETMARDLGCSLDGMIGNAGLISKIPLEKYASETIGMPTLLDIKAELAKPGRDPREPFALFSFQDGVQTLEDLRPGMKLPGVVTNITAFGAFVDIGVHQDGLLHISQLARRYIKDPHEVVSVHQKVMVTVVGVDLERKRIALSMRAEPGTSSSK
ncbi:MAG: RNA-binding transcriptional accessory protein [Candidatus Omnitrophica bacterium]|nr:RNA-binding transcriptional accessory protein [Candidatus Omnitrophota bacterium]